MIDVADARPGLPVFYQKSYMRCPEYGVVVRANDAWARPRYVFVLFPFGTTPKACPPADLFPVPDLRAADRTIEGAP